MWDAQIFLRDTYEEKIQTENIKTPNNLTHLQIQSMTTCTRCKKSQNSIYRNSSGQVVKLSLKKTDKGLVECLRIIANQKKKFKLLRKRIQQ